MRGVLSAPLFTFLKGMMGSIRKLLIVLTMLVSPIMVFAKGDIVVYVSHYSNVPTNDQLDKLTHIALFSIIPGIDGAVPLPNGGWASNIKSVVDKAHAKNVKVIIVFSGRRENFLPNIQAANREKFINSIINIVNQYNFDGVDIDYEFPLGAQQRDDFGKFLILLKQKLGNKRLSFAIGPQYLPNHYSSATYAAIDALHIMTYDLVGWASVLGIKTDHHADMEETKKTVNSFLTSGLIDKNKVFYGVPFYGRNRTNNKDNTYAGIISGNEATLSQQDFDGTYHYDGIVQVKEKTRYAYEKGAGGIMIWEINQDVAPTSQYSLLNAIWQQTQESKSGASASSKQP